MTSVTTVTMYLNLNDIDDEPVDPDTSAIDNRQLTNCLQEIIPTLGNLLQGCEDAINITEFSMNSLTIGSWTIATEYNGYELVTTYRFEMKIDVRHIGQHLSISAIDNIVNAILVTDVVVAHHQNQLYVGYPVYWRATPSHSSLNDACEAIDYWEYETRCAIASECGGSSE